MATAAELDDDDSAGEYHRPDAKRAIKIYKDEIAPKKAHISTLTGDLSDPHKRIKDECHFPRGVLDFLIKLDDMEEAKRDHWLLAMNLGMTELGLFMPRDLATMAEGTDGGEVIPLGKRSRPKLATIGQPSDGSETDLSDAAEFDEASEEELAQQEGRAAPGTGAAAIAAMRADHAADKAEEAEADAES